MPTITVTADQERLRMNGTPPHSLKRAEEGAVAHRRSLELALQAGVRIAAGADMNPMWATSVKEVYWLGKCGLTNLQALQAGTIRGAELCGVDREVGTIEPGKVADLIAVEGNPLQDLACLRNVAMVFQAGELVVDRRDAAGRLPQPRW